MNGRHVLALVSFDPEECGPNIPTPVVRLSLATLQLQEVIRSLALIVTYTTRPFRDIVWGVTSYVVAIRAKLSGSRIAMTALLLRLRSWCEGSRCTAFYLAVVGGAGSIGGCRLTVALRPTSCWMCSY